MKVYVSLVLFMILSLSGFAQSLDEKSGLFTPLDLYDQLSFDINIGLYNNPNQNDTFVLLNDMNTSTFKVDSEKLNTKLFSNIEIIENTYKDYRDFFRLCSPLDNGIANTGNSGDEMLHNILNNFVNNVLFNGRGPINRLFNVRSE